MQTATTTAPYTKLLHHKDFRFEFQKASINLINACDNGGMLLNDAGRPIGFYDGITLINQVAIDRKWSGIVRKTFLQCYMASETRSRGSGVLACYVLSKLFAGNRTISKNEITEILKKSRLISEELAVEQIKCLVDHSFADMFFNILGTVGTAGQVNIRNGSKSFMALEIFSGHNFEIGIDPAFCKDNIERDVCGIFLIDGVIESVSEIDRILRYCSENGTTLLIIARKFSNDVLSTLNANFQRGTLDVIPILAKDKISTLNIFSDLSITTGGNVINEHSGQTIIGADPKELVFVSGLKCSKKTMKYNSNQVMRRSIKKRISELKLKIERAIFDKGMSEEDVRVFLRGRINSLSTSSATLWLPAGSDKNGFYKFVDDRFRFSISFLDGFCKFGAVDISETILGNDFKDIGISLIPANILFHSVSVARDISKSINHAGGCIVIDKSI